MNSQATHKQIQTNKKYIYPYVSSLHWDKIKSWCCKYHYYPEQSTSNLTLRQWVSQQRSPRSVLQCTQCSYLVSRTCACFLSCPYSPTLALEPLNQGQFGRRFSPYYYYVLSLVHDNLIFTICIWVINPHPSTWPRAINS